MKRLLPLLLLLLLPPGTGPLRGQQPEEPPPREIGLVEQVGRRLAQLDVTVTGPRDAIADLTREDFDLAIAGRSVDDFLVDSICTLEVEAEAEADRDEQERPAAPPPGGGATFLFYFDHYHLTGGGRQGALDTARQLIPRLLEEGDRAMIVSAGKTLETFAEPTSDPQVLLEALDRIEADKNQWQAFPYKEDLRVAEVMRVLHEDQDTQRAIQVARRHARAERANTDEALRLFSTVLDRLIDVPPPKAALYFADTMRNNAGEHYLSFFGREVRENNAAAVAIEMDAFAGAHPFDRVVEEASAFGVRVYTVEARGLTISTGIASRRSGSRAAGADPLPSRRRIRDAQDSLAGMAAETGGESFLNGVPAVKIAKRMREDLRCMYLISFDPSAFPEDQPLRVMVRATRPKVEASTRGQIVLASDSRRRTSRLMARFTSGENTGLEGTLIPIGYDGGKYSALVQVAVPGSPLPQAEWDVGATFVSRGRLAGEASAHVGVNSPGTRVVLEAPVRFAPGPYEITMVANENGADDDVSGQLEGNWPDPDEAPVSLAPLALVQPAVGAFVREGDVRNRGALGRPRVVDTDRDLALYGLVCRSRTRKSSFRLERKIAGDSEASFEPLEPEFGDQRCVLFRDLIPADTLTEGSFTFEVRAMDDDSELASTEARFTALEPGSVERADASTPAD